jgi:hypothetical protein
MASTATFSFSCKYSTLRPKTDADHRRTGPAHLQTTYYFEGGQTLTYGQHDNFPFCRPTDAFARQIEEVDKMRRAVGEEQTTTIHAEEEVQRHIVRYALFRLIS